MKIAKYIFLLVTVFTVVVFLFNVHSKQTKADDLSNTPVIALGTSLKKDQRQQTIKILTQPLHGANYQIISITGNDLVKYLNPTGNNFTVKSGVWSSAMIQKTNNNSIKVQILPYQQQNNITTITANQYTNAALTAGIKSCNIYVTSTVPIDGSGALAGVYKALKEQGEITNQREYIIKCYYSVLICDIISS